MKGYTHPVWVCGYGCGGVCVSLRVYAGKTCWQKSVQVCFVNAVCSGVMHAVRACVCVCVWELEHVCSLRAVRPSAELQPSSGGGWMPSVTPEASVWAQLGFL